MKKDQILIIAIVLLIIAAIASIVIHYERKLNDSELRLDASNGMVSILRNKYNESVAERQSFEGSKQDLKQEIERWKKQGDSLRTKITSSTKQITLLKSELNFKASGKPTIVWVVDTVHKAGEPVDPTQLTYQIDTVNRYIEAHVTVNPYAYQLSIAIKELDVEFVTETKRNGLFGRKYTNVKAISRNPYVSNKDLKSVTIQEKKPLLSKVVVLLIGVVAGLVI